MTKKKGGIFLYLFALQMLIVFIVGSNINDYGAVIEKMVSTFLAPNIMKGNSTTRKYNRTTVVMSAWYMYEVDFYPGDITVQIRGFQRMSNEYKPTAINMELDSCVILASNQFGASEFIKKGNLSTKCPILKGFYMYKDELLTYDLGKMMSSFPPSFQGRWKLQLIYKYKKRTYLMEEFYAKVGKIQ